MPYATSQQVQEEFKDLPITATTAIKAAQVERFIEEADAEIDGRLAARYQTPVTAPAALPMVRRISIGLAAGRIKNMLPIQTGDAGTSVGTEAGIAGRLEKEARALLADIMEERILLADVPRRSSLSGVRSGNVDCGVKHTFRKDRDQW